MKNLILLFGIIGMFVGSFCFAATEEEEVLLNQMKDKQVLPLSNIEGRASLVNIEGEEYLILTTPEGNNYALKGELTENKIKPLEDLENKRLVLAGIIAQTSVEKTVIHQDYDEKTKEFSREGYVIRLTDFLVLYIDTIEEAKDKVTLAKKSADKILPTFVSSAGLQRIRGKVVASNYRSPIPTIEVKDLENQGPNIIMIITSATPILKVVEGRVMNLTRRSIKAGDEVEAWYEDKANQKTARIITVLESILKKKETVTKQ